MSGRQVASGRDRLGPTPLRNAPWHLVKMAHPAPRLPDHEPARTGDGPTSTIQNDLLERARVAPWGQQSCQMSDRLDAMSISWRPRLVRSGVAAAQQGARRPYAQRAASPPGSRAELVPLLQRQRENEPGSDSRRSDRAPESGRGPGAR